MHKNTTQSPNDNEAIQSPCKKVCIVDGSKGMCIGCLRTLPEIAAWGAMTPEQRAEIMAALPGRADAANPSLRPTD
ncbi:MAG: DUF1289 domain-containing protein [Proteobacteria bacterium]|nr:DUF1289 domain-containing protein [Pseudomonadota bacterium]